MLATSVAALTLVLANSTANADIFMTRRPDGTIHLSNVSSQRSRGSVTVVRGTDRPASSANTANAANGGASQVVTFDGTDTPTVQVTSLDNAQVRSLYLSAARDQSRYSRYDAAIHEAATLYQLPESLVRAVIKQESDFNPYSVSGSGASGMMQLMPSTAQSMAVRDVFDARQNILGGTRFLRILANMFNGDLVLTIAAYNAGPNAVIRHAGIPPYEQTQNYVRQVLRYYYSFRAATAAPASAPTTTASAAAATPTVAQPQ